MILVLTGPVHSGKTTLLRKLLPELEDLGLPASGYLSLLAMKEGQIVGYNLFDIRRRQSIPFLRTDGEACWEKVGGYFFLPRGLEAATAAILGSKPGEIIIVDEVGPTELAGRGVWPALHEMLSWPSFDCLLVVRRPLLDDLRNRLGDRPAKMFDVEREGVRSSLIAALSELRAARP